MPAPKVPQLLCFQCANGWRTDVFHPIGKPVEKKDGYCYNCGYVSWHGFYFEVDI